jgi:biopolymer transport protein ExbD
LLEDIEMNASTFATGGSANYARPHINVTPLIDVLLVMLIIFMVAAPLKPSRFLAKVPMVPDKDLPVGPPPLGLVVTIKSDRTLMLNGMADMGSVYDMGKLNAKLVDVFAERLRNQAFRFELRDRVDIPDALRVERTVFIKAPRAIPYADVIRVLDGLKGAGASPVGLQLDDLD